MEHKVSDTNIFHLVKELMDDPDKMNTYTEEELDIIKARLNPCGTIRPVKPSHAIVSVINMREEYLSKFWMTTIIGYLFRILTEYKPKYVVDSEEYLAKVLPTISDKDERDAKNAEVTAKIREYQKAVHDTIYDFLRNTFQFDPDRHVAQASKSFDVDAERLMLDPQSCPDAARIHADVQADIKQPVLCAMHAVRDSVSELQTNLASAANDTSVVASAANEAKKTIDSIINANDPSAKCNDDMLIMKPAFDVFYKLELYAETFYTQLRLITNALYNGTPQFDNLVIYYDSFDDMKSAEQYAEVHNKEFMFKPIIISNGSAHFLGAFSENLENTKYNCADTPFLKNKLQRMVDDQELGKSMIKNRIKLGKQKNIREAGQDAPGLDDYIKSRGIIQEMGKKPALSAEEREKLNVAEQTIAMHNAPDDALTVRILKPVLDESGVPRELSQSFMYTNCSNVRIKSS